MTRIPVQIPPGIFANGTEVQQAGRWNEGSLVRWRNGVMQPVAGWETRLDTSIAKPPRGALAWEDNSENKWIALGFYDALHVIEEDDTVSDITPGGLTSGSEFDPATSWTLNPWGEYLIACSSADGTIYEWQLNTASAAAAVSNAPTGCLGAHVTAERFLFALGPGGNPRKVQWCDREDNTTWTPAATNEAGDFELQTYGKIQTAVNTRSQTLIVTDSDAHVANYIGPPFVYGFDRVGTSCGAITPRSVVPFEGGAMWMGVDGFYAYTGGEVALINCDVWDVLWGEQSNSGRLTDSQASLIHGVLNAPNNEIWWFYPEEGISGPEVKQCNRYVSYNFRDDHWAIGEIEARESAIDQGVFPKPIWFDDDAIAYNHETGNDYGLLTPSARTGPTALADPTYNLSLNKFIPDGSPSGDVAINARYDPNDDGVLGVPRSVNLGRVSDRMDVRISGRYFRFYVEGTNNWRWGTPLVEAVQKGTR